MVAINDNFFMRLAIEEAWKYQFLTYPNPAVGSVVVSSNDEIIGIGAHEEAGFAHAEVMALRNAYVKMSGDKKIEKCNDAKFLHQYLKEKASNIFHECTIYVTLEPCNHTGKTPSCSSLIESLGLKRVVIGTMDPNLVAAGGADRLSRAGIKVDSKILENDALSLIEPFIKWQKGSFLFFKLAQTLNGVIDGGHISCEASRRWVHQVRSKIDLLAIGGSTVRCDRPILDSRLVGKKSPDVSILTSNQETIDRSIPLFSVPDRRVDFIQNIDMLPANGLIMAEGGGGMLRALEPKIEWMVLFVSPKIKEGCGYNATQEFELLHQGIIGDDAIFFLRRKNGR